MYLHFKILRVGTHNCVSIKDLVWIRAKPNVFKIHLGVYTKRFYETFFKYFISMTAGTRISTQMGLWCIQGEDLPTALCPRLGFTMSGFSGRYLGLGMPELVLKDISNLATATEDCWCSPVYMATWVTFKAQWLSCLLCRSFLYSSKSTVLNGFVCKVLLLLLTSIHNALQS